VLCRPSFRSFSSPTNRALSDSYVYDALGNTISRTGSTINTYGYAGSLGYRENRSGLQKLGARYYSPKLGRFMTQDPIGDGENWYNYCDGDPVNAVDPTGNFC
jgi:RHS repeat-associated protein